jgi:hypothetical protein
LVEDKQPEEVKESVYDSIQLSGKQYEYENEQVNLKVLNENIHDGIPLYQEAVTNIHNIYFSK